MNYAGHACYRVLFTLPYDYRDRGFMTVESATVGELSSAQDFYNALRSGVQDSIAIDRAFIEYGALRDMPHVDPSSIVRGDITAPDFIEGRIAELMHGEGNFFSSILEDICFASNLEAIRAAQSALIAEQASRWQADNARFISQMLTITRPAKFQAHDRKFLAGGGNLTEPQIFPVPRVRLVRHHTGWREVQERRLTYGAKISGLLVGVSPVNGGTVCLEHAKATGGNALPYYEDAEANEALYSDTRPHRLGRGTMLSGLFRRVQMRSNLKPQLLSMVEFELITRN